MEGVDDFRPTPEKHLSRDPEICFTAEQAALRALIDHLGEEGEQEDV